MVPGNDNRFFDRGQSPPCRKVECAGDLEQIKQKMILCQLMQEPSAGTVPSVRYKKLGNVWLIYSSLHYNLSWFSYRLQTESFWVKHHCGVKRVEGRVEAVMFKYSKCYLFGLFCTKVSGSLIPRPLPTWEKGLVSTVCACIKLFLKYSGYKHVAN